MSEMEDKLNSLSPEELNALNTDPELLQAFKTKYGTHGHATLQDIMSAQPGNPQSAQKMYEEKGLQELPMGFSSPDKPLETAGEAIATSKFGQQNPYAGAALGTAVAKAPEIVGAVQGISAAPEIAAAGTALVKGGLSAVGKTGQAIGDVVSTLKGPGEAESKIAADNLITQQAPQAVNKAKQVMQPMLAQAQDAITTLKQSLAQVPQQFSDKLGSLKELNQAAKSAMQKVEETVPGLEFKGGEGFDSYVKNSQKMSQLAEVMAKWKGKIPEGMPLQQKQLFRKLAQEGADSVNNISRAVLQQGREALAQNVAAEVPKWGEARQGFQQVQDAMKSLPAEKLNRTTALKSGLLKAQNELKDMQTAAQNLVSAAKNADAEQLLDLKKQANDLIQKGIKHDQYVKNLWKTAGAAGLAAVGVKKFGIGE